MQASRSKPPVQHSVCIQRPFMLSSVLLKRTEGSTAVVYFQADQQTIANYPRGGAASTATYRYVFSSYIDEPVVRKLVAFYVGQHNSHVPHSAFREWQTPDEMYFSKGAEVPEQLKVARIVARRKARIESRSTMPSLSA